MAAEFLHNARSYVGSCQVVGRAGALPDLNHERV